jgi:hypothetical protein
MLQNATLKNMLEAGELKDYWKHLQMGLNYLTPPSQDVKDLPKMDFKEEGKLAEEIVDNPSSLNLTY